MSFFAVLISLLIEQLKPMPRNNRLVEGVSAWLGWAGRNFHAGLDHHAWVVWVVTIVGPVVLVAGVSILLAPISPVLSLAWDIIILYVTLGFRQFSHFFTDIRDALERGDEQTARERLSQWRHLDASELPTDELLRQVIEHSLLAAHRHVFGVFFWFLILGSLGLGPAGALLFRLAELASRYWSYRSKQAQDGIHDHLMKISQQAFGWIDYIPARLTAFGFAVVGNFEESITGWRRDASLWQQANEGIILAAAAGAIGVRLGGAAPPELSAEPGHTFDSNMMAEMAEASGSTAGVTPALGHLRSIVGLVWRSVILWMLLLALLSVSNMLG